MDDPSERSQLATSLARNSSEEEALHREASTGRFERENNYRQSRGSLLRTLKGFLSLLLVWIAWDDQNLMQEVAKMSLYMWQVGLWAGKGGEGGERGKGTIIRWPTT